MVLDRYGPQRALDGEHPLGFVARHTRRVGKEPMNDLNLLGQFLMVVALILILYGVVASIMLFIREYKDDE